MKIFLFIIILVSLFVAPSTAQLIELETVVQRHRTSLDTPPDIRSVMMGESFVAVQHTLSSLFYNPAGIGSINGVAFSYTYRSNNVEFANEPYKFHSIMVAGETPYINIGIFYSTYFRYDYITTYEANPDMVYGTIPVNDYMYGIGLGKKIGENLFGGITIKLFDYGENFLGNANSSTISTIVKPVLFDFGITYSIHNLFSGIGAQDNFSAGMSFQNIGTNFKRHKNFSVTDYTQDYFIDLPLYFNLGFAYSYTLLPQSLNGYTPLDILLTGQLHNYLSPREREYKNQRDVWGTGIDVTIYDVVSLIGGIRFTPTSYDGLYPSYRYGVGLNIPLSGEGQLSSRTVLRLCDGWIDSNPNAGQLYSADLNFVF